jgi:hypothetical protein
MRLRSMQKSMESSTGVPTLFLPAGKSNFSFYQRVSLQIKRSSPKKLSWREK